MDFCQWHLQPPLRQVTRWPFSAMRFERGRVQHHKRHRGQQRPHGAGLLSSRCSHGSKADARMGNYSVTRFVWWESINIEMRTIHWVLPAPISWLIKPVSCQQINLRPPVQWHITIALHYWCSKQNLDILCGNKDKFRLAIFKIFDLKYKYVLVKRWKITKGEQGYIMKM